MLAARVTTQPQMHPRTTVASTKKGWRLTMLRATLTSGEAYSCQKPILRAPWGSRTIQKDVHCLETMIAKNKFRILPGRRLGEKGGRKERTTFSLAPSTHLPLRLSPLLLLPPTLGSSQFPVPLVSGAH